MKNKPKILIDSSSLEERRSFFKRIGRFAFGVSLLGGFTNIFSRNTYSGRELFAAVSADPFVGSISMTAFGSFAPTGWANCDGSLISISKNPLLFSVIGTTFGGDGRSNYSLPDMKGRAPMHYGSAPGIGYYQIGQKIGNYNHMLITANMPSHNHITEVDSRAYEAKMYAFKPGDSLTHVPEGAMPAKTDSVKKIYSKKASDHDMGESALENIGDDNPKSATLSNNGDYTQKAIDLSQPSLCVNFIISLVGQMPERS